jgi:2-oxoglutarate ferredoxin oxidoreductase subunit gamma
MIIEMICSGFGGQGALTVGKFLSLAAMKEGKDVSWLPSYGPEMRGGTANVAVVISDKQIASPLVNHPDLLIALNKPSVDKFGPMIKSGGLMIANSDMCPDKLNRKDIEEVYAPMSSIATEIGSTKVLNMVSLGVIISKTELVKYETVEKDLREILGKKNPTLLEANLKAIKKGMELGKKA